MGPVNNPLAQSTNRQAIATGQSLSCHRSAAASTGARYLRMVNEHVRNEFPRASVTEHALEVSADRGQERTCDSHDHHRLLIGRVGFKDG
jgi:hypothetical protein